MPARDHAASLRALLSEKGVATSLDLQQAIGVSQPTIARALAALREEVMALGRGPATRYALRRIVARVGGSVGVYSIAPDGAIREEGQLDALAGSRYWFAPAG